MKKQFTYFAVLACIILSSCESTYRFYQVYETKPIQQNEIASYKNGELVYENNQCAITYYFWADQGSMGFEFYNKTDKMIYIDLTKSFFTRNDVAYTLYKNREWNTTTSSSVSIMNSTSSQDSYSRSRSLSGSFSVGGTLNPTFTNSYLFDQEMVSASISSSASSGSSRSTGSSKGRAVSSAQSYGITFKEQPIIAIPPHKKKYISTYSITDHMFYSCDIQSYPKSISTQKSFTQENTPLVFSNYVSYSVGESKDIITIENGFYVSTITNYSEPEIIEYRKREKPCENLIDVPKYATHKKGKGIPLYDAYIKDSVCNYSSSFYYLYEVRTGKKLYKNKFKGFWYSPEYDAYYKREN